MLDGLNQISNNENITDIISSDGFDKLESNLQGKIIDSVQTVKEKDGGYLGRFLGVKASNVSMNIVFLVCIMLMLYLFVDMIHAYIVSESINIELVKTIIPAFTLIIGFIFGKGSNT